MSNIPSEVGKVAGSAIDALKGSPALLAVILLQLVTLGVLFIASQRNQERAHAREMFLMEQCFPKKGDRVSFVTLEDGPRLDEHEWWMPAN